jgi:hypothetical protein
MTPLVMKVSSPRYGTKCAKCGQRIRVGRLFVISPIDSRLVFHKACAPERFV